MVSKACCTNPVPPTVAAYTPTGTAQKVGSFDVYVTGAGTRYAICIYDIFGFDVRSLTPYKHTHLIYTRDFVRFEKRIPADCEHAAIR